MENDIHNKEVILNTLSDGDYFLNPCPPYISQVASRELVSDMIDGSIVNKIDPKWKEFGFDTIEEYNFWIRRICAIACTKMIIDTFESSNESLAVLAKKGMQYGGYIVNDELGRFVDKGWYYAPLIEVLKEYSFHGKIYAEIDENILCQNVIENMFSVISVHPGVIRFDMEKCPSDQKGGHLVLVVGFQWENQKCNGFYIHNPSGREQNTQEKAYVPIQRFKEAFANKGFVVEKDRDSFIEKGY